jgi:hypothetical protein
MRRIVSVFMFVFGMVTLCRQVWSSEPTGSLQGQVFDMDADSEAVIGAKVIAAVPPDTGQYSRIACTDANGHFRFQGLRPGRWHLMISALGYTDVDSTMEIIADSTTVLRIYVKEHHIYREEIDGPGWSRAFHKPDSTLKNSAPRELH